MGDTTQGTGDTVGTGGVGAGVGGATRPAGGVLPGVMPDRVREAAAALLEVYPDATVRQLAGHVAVSLNLNSAAERAEVLRLVVEWDCEAGE